jgi:hypothetical protein
MKELCCSQYEHESAEQTYQYVKQQISYYNGPSQSIRSWILSYSGWEQSIPNADVRQAFLDECRPVAEQSRTALHRVYSQSAADQQVAYKNIYTEADKQLKSNQEAGNITPTMVDLIRERANKIKQRLQCIYKFKHESLLSTPR